MRTKHAAITATTTLPTIVRFLGTTDHGPCDDGEPSAYCPHCNSGGRYIHSFVCDDGTTRGAMSGCIKLFRVHPLANEDMKIAEREEDLKKRFGKDAHLNSWDTKTREAIHAWYAGTMTETQAMAAVKFQASLKRSYRQRAGKRW